MSLQNRRNFIKSSTMAAGVTMLTSAPSENLIENVLAQQKKTSIKNSRVLGSGSNSITVNQGIGLGCMGMSYHRSFIPEKTAMIALLRKAYEQGLNFYDTAEAYGPLVNEALIGEALIPFRKEVIIATKFGFKNGRPSEGLDSRPERIRSVVEHSLKSLKTDYIDLLYQHRVDPNIPIEDVAGTVRDLIKEGKVKYFGLSEASSANIRKAHSIQPLTALQSEYSLMTRQPETGALKVCEELGIGFVSYSPLSRGMLTGYLNERSKYDPTNDNRPSLPRYQPQNVIANWPLIEVLKTFGDERGLTVAQVALAWLLAQKPFIVAIPGTTKPAHFYENFQASQFEFSSSELHTLSKAINKIPIVGDRYTGLAAQQTEK